MTSSSPQLKSPAAYLLGVTVTASQLDYWTRRGRITRRTAAPPKARPLYRVGDVQDHVETTSPARTSA